MAEVVDHRYELLDVDSVTPHPHNPRVGPVDAITDSIEANGFYGAIVVHEQTGHILIGNHRYAAAVKAGITRLPAIVISCDESRARRIMLADNRYAELAQWNDETLSALLAELSTEPGALIGTGFTTTELAALLSADDFTPADETNRVDVSREHECPACGYTWRVDADDRPVPT
jgi:ParB-like chromosome segregation protein Spo0J